MQQQKAHLEPLPAVYDGMTLAQVPRVAERQTPGAACYAIPSRRALSEDQLHSEPTAVEPAVTSQPFSATPLSFSGPPNQAEKERKTRWWSFLCFWVNFCFM